MKKKFLLGSSLIVAAMPIVSSISMKLNEEPKGENAFAFSDSKIKLSEQETQLLKSSDVYKNINSRRHQINNANINNFIDQINESALSENIKSYLRHRLKVQIGFNASVKNIKKNRKEKRTQNPMGRFLEFDDFQNEILPNLDLPDVKMPDANAGSSDSGGAPTVVLEQQHLTNHAGVLANPDEPFTFANVFEPQNYVQRRIPVRDSFGKILYSFDSTEEHKKIVYKSGTDEIYRDYHTFDDDVTIINVSNDSIWKDASNSILGEIKDDPRYHALMEQNQHIAEVFDLIKKGVEYSPKVVNAAVDLLKRKAIIFNDELIKKKYGKIADKMSLLTDVMSFCVQLDDYMRDANNNFVDAIIQSGVQSGLVSTGVSSLATLIAAPLGPFAPIVGMIAEKVVDAIFNHVTENGHTTLSNMADHGLNDWDFQLKNNADTISKLQMEFSEGCIHGVSWMVKDAIDSTPNLWIKPGQSATTSWVKLSNDFYDPTTHLVKKSFVWGEKIRFVGYEGTTKLAEQCRAQDGFYGVLSGTSITDSHKVYEDVLEVGIPEILRSQTGEVEKSDTNKNFTMSLISRTLHPMYKYFMDFEGAPGIVVHENDHDDDNAVKGWNWNSNWNNNPPVILRDWIYSNEDYMHFKIHFDDGKEKMFPQLDSRLRLVARRAAEFFEYVVRYGSHPHYENGERDDSKPFQPFHKDMHIIPVFHLSHVSFGWIKFNTFDDKGYDDTHSDYFRFGNAKIGIRVSFIEIPN